MGDEAKPSPPNILLFIADDWGCHAGAYGTPWVKTPAFDRIAREGLLFRNCHTPNAKCAPSRACLLTGRNSWQLREAANHICYFPPEFKSWCEALAEQGWNVGHTKKGWGPGSAKTSSGKVRNMTGTPWNEHTLSPATEGIANTDYAANFAAFLDAANKSQPWCFWMGPIEPHRDFEFGSGVAKGGKKLTDIDRVPDCWPNTETVRHDMLDYAFEIEQNDHMLARALATLEERGLLDQTLVLVTSDHGMPFPRGKGNTYDLSTHVPLAVRWPAGIRESGREIEAMVSFVDLAPTVLELAGKTAEQCGLAPLAGRTLTPLFRNEAGAADGREQVLVGRERNDIGRPGDGGYPVRGIRQREWLYLANLAADRWPCGNPETGYLDCDASPTKTLLLERGRHDRSDPHWQLCFGKRPAEELYFLPDDPYEVRNLASDPRYAKQREALRAQLWRELAAQGDPRATGEPVLFDSYLHANKGHVNFYERFQRGEKMNTGWVLPTDYEPQALD
jgi:arylsulfatase A-like enzyme